MPDSLSDSLRNQLPERPTTTVVVRVPRRSRLALVLAAATAIAVVPAAQALAAGHPEPGRPSPAAGASSVAGGTDQGGPGESSRRQRSCTSAPGSPESAGVSGAAGTAGTARTARFDERTWWPFNRALHGVDVVETTDGGIQTVTFQRGTVQAVSATSVTVLSKDSVSQTWALGDSTKVWVRGRPCSLADLSAGQYVGIWGAGSATAPAARFVVVKAGGPARSPSATPSVSGTPSGSGS